LDDFELSEGFFLLIRNNLHDEYVLDDKIVAYVNGGCLPRITCVPVYAQQATTGGIIFPNCVEVHRCAGCCQEAQFSCEPTKIEYISFSPVNNFIFLKFFKKTISR
jgi:hypothetical protein